MSLKIKDLDHVLKLAHLEIPEDEKPSYLEALNNTLDHMQAMDELPLDGVDASAYARSDSHFQREDTPSAKQDLFLEKNAPEWEEGCFSVPRIN